MTLDQKLNKLDDGFEQAINEGIDPALYWAGQMAEAGKDVLKGTPCEMSDRARILHYCIRNYNTVILEQTEDKR